jgi:hypothetical protein
MSSERETASGGVVAPRGTRHGWNDEEIAALRRLSRLLSRRRGAEASHLSETETGEPQFYVLGPRPDEACLACVSRVGSRYVLDDGSGRLLADEADIADLVKRAFEAYPVPRTIPFATRAFLVVCAWRAFVDQKMASLEESLEMLSRIAPHISALA